MQRIYHVVAGYLLAAALTATAGAVWASDAGQLQVVQGVEIYFGMLPSEIFHGHPKEHPEGTMHGGVPATANSYHLLVALFDRATGKRIVDAEITAWVSEGKKPAPRKKLEPMLMAGTASYGNFFSMPSSGPYRIHVQIRRAGVAGVIEAEFDYLRARA